MPSYIYALQLVCVLPGYPLEAAKRVRERVGALSVVTMQDLGELFPTVDKAILSKLTNEFVRDAG